MAKIITVADLPDELAEQWLMHLRVFDRAHPNCRFRVIANSGQALEEVRAIISNLELPEVAVFERVVENAVERKKKGMN